MQYSNESRLAAGTFPQTQTGGAYIAPDPFYFKGTLLRDMKRWGRFAARRGKGAEGKQSDPIFQLFQIRGPAAAKLLCPKPLRTRVTEHFFLKENLRERAEHSEVG